jgi:hypothetical protein
MKLGLLRPLVLSLSLAWWCVPCQAQTGYAVQVASVQTRTEAAALINNLRKRGVQAYWVKAEVPGKGVYYRVRAGAAFANGKLAADFGQKLLAAGSITEFAIFKYDPPAAETRQRPARRQVTATNVSIQTAPLKTDKQPEPAVEPVAPPVPTERTGYLITGNPLPTETPKPDNGRKVERPTDTAARVAKVKHSDEVELDDFKEFTQALQGAVEVKDGTLFVTLQNRNQRYSFRGQAHLSFSEGERNRNHPTIQLELAPGQEQVFEIAPGVSQQGNYLLMVYDDQGARHLLQHGALAKRAGKQDLVAKTTSPSPGDVPPVPVSGEGSATAGSDSGGNPVEAGEEQTGPRKPVSPEDVKVNVQRIAATPESVAVELEILATQPLGMISVSIRTESLNDVKEAMMTTRQGRMPFLVPASDTGGALSWELRDEHGRVLSAGSKPFSEIGR